LTGKKSAKSKPAQPRAALHPGNPKAGSPGTPTGAAKTASSSRSPKDHDVAAVEGAVKSAMPRAIHPMLATLVDEPFDDDKWLFEIKWDGYRSVAFVNEKGDRSVRLVSRNQNEQTHDFPELQVIGKSIRAETAILDGEIVALDEQGRASFSLMQQRSGFQGPDKRSPQDRSVQIIYYVFDLLYLDGYSLLRTPLEKRKELLSKVLIGNDRVRLSEHFVGKGHLLMKAAAAQNLEGIVAKLRNGHYIQKRSSEWLKMKRVQRQECVIGGYTDPRGSRENFGSLVLGLYDDQDRLIPVGQAGSGFTEKSHAEMWKRLEKLKTDRSPFYGKVESPRRVHYVKPEMVAEIRFTEWTHEGQSGQIKMRAPVFLGLRTDKKPRECRFEVKKSAVKESKKAEEEGEAA
ncbi:MAG TPA: non-homologous end-joining DNA ligase, partial [Terriglobales bacterium]